MLRAFIKCAMVLAKRPQFLFFTIVNCIMKKKHFIQVSDEYSLQLSKLLYNCKLKNKEAL